jgi:predicted nucleotidyltransferase component of viral defense system
MNVQQTVEYFHLLFLLFISRKIDRKYYILKGGCSLRFFFKSPRYSEDINFDLQGIPVQEFRGQVNKLLRSAAFRDMLLVKDITIGHVTEHKQMETTQRWKLSLNSLQRQTPVPTRIEFSRRQRKKGESRFEAVDSVFLKKYELPPVLVNHYSAEGAFRQKINAMSFRGVPQARDIFDLYFLLATSGEAVASSLEKMDKNVLSKAKNNIFSINYNAFKSQVVSYLNPDDRGLYESEETWDMMRLKVIEALEK